MLYFKRRLQRGAERSLHLANVDELICRSVKGAASREELARLLAWRSASAANERHYLEILQLLDEVTVAVLEEETDPPPLIEDLLSPHSFDLEPRRRKWLRRPAVGAAGLLLAASIAGVVVAPRVRTPDGNGFGTGEIITGMSESTTIRLGDGTIVRLGPESRLRVVGDRDRREVWMEGRAFFAVARDEARPFHVRTHAGDAVVLGTRFDLEARDDLRVLVVEGAVRLGADGKELDIESSQLGTIAPDHPPTQKELDPDAMAEELSWVGNFIVFENTPLARAATELSTHYDIPVAVLDSALARETVSGVFVDEEVNEVARIICRAVAAHCSIREAGITIGL